ncbi:hypothetical protein ISS05_00610 [Candidatus Woesearchaeota archaeon]|nr:hypothetical protein [Candidatus Woesearchaeota archaeon]
MQNLTILNKKQAKEILKLIKKQFNADFKSDYAFLKNEKEKIYLIHKDISVINIEKLRINSFGMYFAQIRNNEIRLSIEGSQLIGPKADKNILEIDEKQTKEWMAGTDLEIEGDYSGFVLVKHNKDFLGCGKARDGKVFNFVGKARRITTT